MGMIYTLSSLEKNPYRWTERQLQENTDAYLVFKKNGKKLTRKTV